MNKVSERVTLKTKAVLNTGQTFEVYVEPFNDEYYKDHPKVIMENFENQSYMVGNLLLQYKGGTLDNGLFIDGNLKCVNIIEILKELKILLDFKFNIY